MGIFCILVATMAILPTTSSEASAADLSGRWRGRWVSATTGHQGPLSARFRQVSADEYRVVFHGRFWKVVPFRYALNMQVQSSNDQSITFAGQKSLGRLFGNFEYQAQVTGSQFHATYQSRKDHGAFQMSRP